MDKKIIINIGRQLGSGGHDIGRMLAMDFNAKYYDRELLNLAAKESGFSTEFFERNDEKKSFLRSFLHLPYGTGNGSTNFYNNDFSQESLFKFQSDAIRKAANEGSCVRISNVANKQNISRDEALKVIEHGEKARAEYYNYYTGKQWGHATSYDLCIDSSQLGLLDTEKFIAEFVRRRFGIHK